MPARGTVTVEPEAITFAAKGPHERGKLSRLTETANRLADNGYHVRVLGEDPAHPGDLAIEGPGLQSEIAGQSKRLNAGTKNAVKNNLQDGTKQAGDAGLTVIDGSGVGLTHGTFLDGFQQFLRNSVKNRRAIGGTGKTGMVIGIMGDGSTTIVAF
jgi:hypothetical protein